MLLHFQLKRKILAQIQQSKISEVQLKLKNQEQQQILKYD